MDPGFRAQGVLLASFELGKQGREDTVVRQLLQEVRAAPHVISAAATTNFLIGSGMWSLVVRTDFATRDSRFTWVSPDFFATLGTPILAGRDLSSNDRRTSPKVAIVNEIFAQTFFPGTEPIGKTFRTATEPDYPEAEYEIVGLVKNSRYFALQATEPPMVYGSVQQFPPGVTGTMIFIRSSAPSRRSRRPCAGASRRGGRARDCSSRYSNRGFPTVSYASASWPHYPASSVSWPHCSPASVSTAFWLIRRCADVAR